MHERSDIRGTHTFLAITTGLFILYFCQFYLNLTCDKQPLHCHILAALLPNFPWKYHKAWRSVIVPSPGEDHEQFGI